MYDLAELHSEQAELLPAREALGGININNVVATNVAVAINVGDHGEAVANAYQYTDVGQG